jgi:CHAD domain-containing protein
VSAAELGKKPTAGAVVQARLATQAEELRALDPLVRSDTPDAVHRMRVAIRRLRSALATFRPLLDRSVSDPLRDELAWLAGVLGEARDTEVMHERLTAVLDAEPGETVRGGARGRVDADLDERYRRAREQALAALGSPRYRDLVARLDALVAAPPWTAAARRPARKVLRSRVAHDWRRLERRYAEATAAHDPADRALHLHETRKAAKRLRYAAETAVPVSGKKARRLVKRTKRLQTILGEHHDSVVTRAWLRDAADRTAAEGEDTFTFGVLHVREEQVAEQAEARLPKAWRKADRARRRWPS